MTSMTFSYIRVEKAERLTAFPSPAEIKADPLKV